MNCCKMFFKIFLLIKFSRAIVTFIWTFSYKICCNVWFKFKFLTKSYMTNVTGIFFFMKCFNMFFFSSNRTDKILIDDYENYYDSMKEYESENFNGKSNYKLPVWRTTQNVVEISMVLICLFSITHCLCQFLYGSETEQLLKGMIILDIFLI